MIHFWPKLYRTPGCCHLFIRLPKRPYQGMPLWQGVKRIAGPIYRNVYPPFHDYPNMFERVTEPHHHEDDMR